MKAGDLNFALGGLTGNSYPSNITDSPPTETLSELLIDTAETDKNSISSAIIFVEI